MGVEGSDVGGSLVRTGDGGALGLAVGSKETAFGVPEGTDVGPVGVGCVVGAALGLAVGSEETAFGVPEGTDVGPVGVGYGVGRALGPEVGGDEGASVPHGRQNGPAGSTFNSGSEVSGQPLPTNMFETSAPAGNVLPTAHKSRPKAAAFVNISLPSSTALRSKVEMSPSKESVSANIRLTERALDRSKFRVWLKTHVPSNIRDRSFTFDVSMSMG